MASKSAQLVMIYNAEGGILNGLRDSFWKTFAPQTYPCALCALAFGFFRARKPWREFLKRVPLEKRELHLDDYREALPEFIEPLPVIALSRSDGSIEVLVSAAEMNAMDRLDQLIALVEQRLAEHHRADVRAV